MSTDTRTALVAIRRVLDCFAVDKLPDHWPAQQNVSPIRVGDIRKAREAADQLAAPVGEQEKACVTCRHFLPWNRQAMRGNGDCHQPRLRGHLNGIEETFGCRLHERHP